MTAAAVRCASKSSSFFIKRIEFAKVNVVSCDPIGCYKTFAGFFTLLLIGLTYSKPACGKFVHQRSGIGNYSDTFHIGQCRVGGED